VAGKPVAPTAAPGVELDQDRPRASIEERAQRRERLQAGRDRYAALLRSLQAGRDVQLARPGGRFRVEWHPILRRLILVTIAVLVLWFGAWAGLDWIRRGQLTTWTGPDATVQSGQVLQGCPIVNTIDNPVFPSWVRWNGSIYRYSGWKRPFMGIDRTAGFSESGYRTGDLHLYLIDNTPDGKSRDTVLLWFEGGIAGVEYARTPDCT
jgi:hypothetical protein